MKVFETKEGKQLIEMIRVFLHAQIVEDLMERADDDITKLVDLTPAEIEDSIRKTVTGVIETITKGVISTEEDEA